jgi:hypothetical protein
VLARDNPFRVQRLDALAYRLQGEGWEALLDRARSLAWRGALVGPEGHGKSTLLAELAHRLASQGMRPRWLRVRRGERWPDGAALAAFLADAGPRDLLLVDGTQELAPLAWRALRWRARHAGGLLATSHRPGHLPTLLDCRTSPALLAELLAELDPQGAVELPPVAELWARHRGNLRSALLEAYDRAATLPG